MDVHAYPFVPINAESQHETSRLSVGQVIQTDTKHGERKRRRQLQITAP